VGASSRCVYTCLFQQTRTNSACLLRSLTCVQPGGSEEHFFSMLSPAEWGSACPTHVASYYLEHDMSYTRLEDRGRRPPIDATLLGLNGTAASGLLSLTSK
jgi:hypothetical protein